MPSFELNKLQTVTGARALSDTDLASKLASPAAGSADTRPNSAQSAQGVAIEVSRSVDTAKPPVDSDRVAEIRNALKDGSYPLVPAKIADAMIAAQLSFGIKE